MRIWHLSSNRWNSAITEYAISAARALAGRGHETLFTPLEDSPAERRALALGLTTRSLPRFTGMQVGLARGIARDFEPDVLFTYGGPETFLARFLGVRLVRVRGSDVDPEAVLEGPKQRLSHGHVAAVVTPSRVLAEKMSRVLPRVPVVPVTLGCDTEKFHRVEAGALPAPVAVIFGRFDPVKGHAQFLRVWRRVKELVPGALLHIVGEPANVSVAHLEHYAREAALVLGRDVKITAARVGNVAALLSGATLGVVPSIGSEIIGRVAEEFLLCGTPVLVSGVGSLDEVLFDETAGASWRGLDEGATAELVSRWLLRSAEEGEDAKRARAASAHERFSLAAMGEALSRVVRP